MGTINSSRVYLSALLCCCLLAGLPKQAAAVKKVYTVAGGGALGDGGPATSAALANPQYAAYDQQRNLYFTERYGHRLRKVSKDGIITTIAGNGISGFSGDGGPAASAKVSFPKGLVMDDQGNIFFADGGNNRVRKIDPSGIIITIAGNGTPGYSGDGGPATAASLNSPSGLAVSGGNLYIADFLNSVIRMVDAAGIIHTVAGNGTPGFSGDGGPATSAQLNFPEAVTLDSSANLYIADGFNDRVRKVDAAGMISTFAGNGDFYCHGDGGPATSAGLTSPRGVTIHGHNLLIAVCSSVRTVNLDTNIINTIVEESGSGYGSGYDGDGHNALHTKLSSPRGMLFDAAGDLVIVDTFNNRIRRVFNLTQRVRTIAGGAIGDGGPATDASLNGPPGFNFDAAGNMYIADQYNHRIREVDASGTITTFAGTGITGNSGDGGQAKLAQLGYPAATASDSLGNFFLADEDGTKLRKVDQAGIISTLSPEPFFDVLSDLIGDGAGNIYGADWGTCVIWKFAPDGTASIVAGVEGFCGYNSDGIPATEAWLYAPWSVALDSHGNLYIADLGNNRVRKVNHKTGLISTVAGNGSSGFSGDGGPAKKATLFFPYGVAAWNGQVYIADTGNFRIRWVDSSGIIRTLAGTGKQGYNGDGLAAKNTNLDGPVAIAVGPDGTVYYDDAGQSRIRKIQ